jgi:genome maintenance exonuclease 1
MFDLRLLNFPPMEAVTNETGRYYTTPQGNIYPSVTSVLKATGNTKFLVDWKKRIGEDEAARESGFASLRGNAVHNICEKFVLGQTINKLKEPSYAISLFGQIKPVLIDNVTTVVGVETPLYSDVLQIAGRTDLIARFAGKRSIIDYKTSKKIKPKKWAIDYFLQSTIYAICFEELTGVPINQIVVIIANEIGTKPTVFIEPTSYWINDAIDRCNKFNLLTAPKIDGKP